MKQKRIFISTQATSSSKLYGLFGGSDFRDIRAKLNSTNIELLESNDAIFFDTDTKTFNAVDNNASIIVIRDGITALPNIDRENDYLLWHTQTKKEILESFDKLKQGQHTAKDEYLYFPVFKIILDDEDKKIERIIEKVFTAPEKLESVLKFLHECLDKQATGEKLQADDFLNIADIKEFREKYTNIPITDAMIIDMRDKLLAVAMEN